VVASGSDAANTALVVWWSFASMITVICWRFRAISWEFSHGLALELTAFSGRGRRRFSCAS
jgi:hypothetical protein